MLLVTVAHGIRLVLNFHSTNDFLGGKCSAVSLILFVLNLLQLLSNTCA